MDTSTTADRLRTAQDALAALHLHLSDQPDAATVGSPTWVALAGVEDAVTDLHRAAVELDRG